MAQYRPALPFSTPAYLLKPVWETVKGVRKKTFPYLLTMICFSAHSRPMEGQRL